MIDSEKAIFNEKMSFRGTLFPVNLYFEYYEAVTLMVHPHQQYFAFFDNFFCSTIAYHERVSVFPQEASLRLYIASLNHP